MYHRDLFLIQREYILYLVGPTVLEEATSSRLGPTRA